MANNIPPDSPRRALPNHSPKKPPKATHKKSPESTRAGIQKPQKKRRPRMRVSILYLLMVAVMFVLGQGYEIAVYTIAMVLHELAHAEVAERLGYTLSGFRLMPYGASLTGSFEGARYKDELAIAVAGPLFNIFLAVPAVALWWLVPVSYYITKLFVTANLFIALFNLLPVFPLDGGRMLLAIFSENRPRQKVYRVIRIFGFVVAGGIAALFVLSLFFGANFSFATAAVFIFVSSAVPDKNARYQRLYSMAFRSERLKRGLPVREVMVPKDSTVLSLSRLLCGGHYTRFVLVDGDMTVHTVITESQLERLSLVLEPDKSIAEYMAKNSIADSNNLTADKWHI